MGKKSKQHSAPSPASNPIFTVDADWRVISCNPGAAKFLNTAQQELTGKNLGEILAAQNFLNDLASIRAALAAGHALDNLPITVTASEESETVLLTAIPIPGGLPGSAAAVVSLQNAANPALITTLVLDSLADGVFTVDRNWRITSFNWAAEQITGWARADAIGQSCSAVFHASICGTTCAIAQSIYSGKPMRNRSIFIHNIEGKRLPVSISTAPLLDHEGNVIGGVESFRDLSLPAELRKPLSRRHTFGGIISKNGAMQRIFSILPEIAQSDSNVLILGESGTGKELVASTIHNHSQRQDGPFVAVNCGALPETLLESELFGYQAGAFTDAKEDRPGRFAAAEGGTLFLDEIGDIPAALQVKLLRVLQEKTYVPLGSNTPVKADVRIIAATNRNLKAMVADGLFREDLFYRLNVVKIQLPPLRERKEDIPLLSKHFSEHFSSQKNKDIVGLSDEALSILMRHRFQGNIRELANIIEYAFILCEGGFIQPEHLPESFAPNVVARITGLLTLDKPMPLEEIERHAIFTSLERNKWKKLATCCELGISKDTLRRKISSYKLINPLEDFGQEWEDEG